MSFSGRQPLAARPASDISARVSQRARGIDTFVQKLDALGAEGRLTRTDLERAYGAAFLSFFTFYEKAWEDLFLGLLMRRVAVDPAVEPLVEIKSEIVARNVVRGRRDGYLDWLPARRAVDRAEIFLSRGRPFSDLTDGEMSTVKRYVTVRNALAHESSHARRQFRTTVIGQRPLPPHERRPGGYLRGLHTADQTRLNLALAELTVMFNGLCRSAA